MANQNLYQSIGVSENASMQEIEAATEAKYHETRRLTTHHLPEVAIKATEELVTIERARTILLNPEKRAEYDRSIGMAGGVGGLADPAQILGRFSGLGGLGGNVGVRKTEPQKPAIDQIVALNAWVCNKCQTPNPIGTKFCKKCRNVLGINCPNCGQITEASAEGCTNCGVPLRQVVKQSEMEQEANAAHINEQMRIQPVLNEMQKQSKFASTFMSFWWILLGGIAPILWIICYSKAVSVLNMQDINTPLAVEYKNIASTARSRAKKNLIIFGGLVLLVVICSIISSIASNFGYNQ